MYFGFPKRLVSVNSGNVPKPLTHAVLAVAWGKREADEYVVVKNSWGADWGERGFMRLQAPANTCGLLNMPSYPLLHRQDVLRSELLNKARDKEPTNE